MPIQVNVHEAKSQLSKLIEAALRGEQVTIARAGRPVVDIVVHRTPPVELGVPGWVGLDHDPEIFDGTDEEIQEMFYGVDR